MCPDVLPKLETVKPEKIGPKICPDVLPKLETIKPEKICQTFVQVYYQIRKLLSPKIGVAFHFKPFS